LQNPQNPSGAITELGSEIPGLIPDETGDAARAYQPFAPEIEALALAVPAVSVGFDALITSTVASGRGAGTLGFAGTAGQGGAEPVGLAKLAGDEFGGPSVPMVPGTWEPDQWQFGERAGRR